MTETIPRLRFNTRQINKDVPIREVIAKYTGVPVTQSNKNIKCPSVRHNDNNPSAHIYGNNCKCFACGGNFSPLTLAKEQYPELSFADVCERLLDDFNLDVYNYSNKAEIDAAKCAKKENRFYECFPLTEEELDFIGLQNPKTDVQRVYPVKITEYFAFFFGDIPSDIEVYDENGKEKLIELTESEAIQMEIVPENVKALEGDFTSPTIQQLWKQDKNGIEEMIIDKCYETIEDIEIETEAVEQAVEQYQTNHSKAEIKEAEKIRDRYLKIVDSGGNVRLSDEQKNKIEGFLVFEQRKNVDLPSLNKDREYAEEILAKVLEQQKQREQHGRCGSYPKGETRGCATGDNREQQGRAKTNKKVKAGWDRE